MIFSGAFSGLRWSSYFGLPWAPPGPPGPSWPLKEAPCGPQEGCKRPQEGHKRPPPKDAHSCMYFVLLLGGPLGALLGPSSGFSGPPCTSWSAPCRAVLEAPRGPKSAHGGAQEGRKPSVRNPLLAHAWFFVVLGHLGGFLGSSGISWGGSERLPRGPQEGSSQMVLAGAPRSLSASILEGSLRRCSLGPLGAFLQRFWASRDSLDLVVPALCPGPAPGSVPRLRSLPLNCASYFPLLFFVHKSQARGPKNKRRV